MKKLLLIAAVSAGSCTVMAQDKELVDIKSTAQRNFGDDTTHKHGWKAGGFFAMNVAQGSSSNWAAGAEKFSLSISSSLNLFANLKDGKRTWNNTLDLGYGLVKTTSQGVRKNDDKIDLFSKYGYSISNTMSIAGVFNFRSQFTDGYDYNYEGKGVRRRISGFLAPAYVTVAPGIDWKPASYFSLFFSPISMRWIIVSNDPYSYAYTDGLIPGGGVEEPLAIRYGVDPRRKVRIEAGAYLTANFAKEIAKNVLYKSRLDLYSNYLKGYVAGTIVKGAAKPQNVDMFWTNTFALKVNRFLNVTYQFDLIYDDDVRQFGSDGKSAGTQIRSLLGVGFAAKF